MNLDQARDAADKTRSIMRCIDYPHSNLSPDAQTMLLCLAPFVGVIYVPVLEQYSTQLQQQPALGERQVAQWRAIMFQARSRSAIIFRNSFSSIYHKQLANLR